MTNPLGHHNRGGKWCVHCGVTNGRISRAYVDGNPIPCVRPETPCGHPLAARAVRLTDSTIPPSLQTVCWACEVEAEPHARARAKWDNDAAEYSGPIAHNAQRPSVRLYSEREGVGYSGVQTE